MNAFDQNDNENFKKYAGKAELLKMKNGFSPKIIIIKKNKHKMAK